MGKLLEGLADTYQFLGKPGALLARLGQYAWGVVEVAVPYSLPNVFFKHWLKIVYAFEVFLIVFGALLGFNNTVMRFCVGALLATLAANLVVHYAGWLIEGSGLVRKLIKAVVMLGAALVLLALFALIYFGLVHLGWASLPGGLIGEWIKGLIPASP